MYPVEPIGGGTAPSQIYGASSRQRCGNDGQRKRVAHMPTATTTKEDSRSKLVQNHPHDFTKKLYWIACGCAVLFFVPAAMALVSVGLGAQEAWGWALVFGIMGSMIWLLG